GAGHEGLRRQGQPAGAERNPEAEAGPLARPGRGASRNSLARSPLTRKRIPEAAMPHLKRVLYNVLCRNLADSLSFYRNLLDFDVIYESDWYAVLTPPGQPMVQIGLIDQVSEFTPRHA